VYKNNNNKTTRTTGHKRIALEEHSVRCLLAAMVDIHYNVNC